MLRMKVRSKCCSNIITINSACSIGGTYDRISTNSNFGLGLSPTLLKYQFSACNLMSNVINDMVVRGSGYVYASATTYIVTCVPWILSSWFCVDH